MVSMNVINGMNLFRLPTNGGYVPVLAGAVQPLLTCMDGEVFSTSGKVETLAQSITKIMPCKVLQNSDDKLVYKSMEHTCTIDYSELKDFDNLYKIIKSLSVEQLSKAFLYSELNILVEEQLDDSAHDISSKYTNTYNELIYMSKYPSLVVKYLLLEIVFIANDLNPLLNELVESEQTRQERTALLTSSIPFTVSLVENDVFAVKVEFILENGSVLSSNVANSLDSLNLLVAENLTYTHKTLYIVLETDSTDNETHLIIELDGSETIKISMQ